MSAQAMMASRRHPGSARARDRARRSWTPSMPMSIAPRTPRAVRTAISASVPSASSTGVARNVPSVTIVDGDGTTMPAHSRPMNEMSRPMPTVIACFRDSGTAVMTRSRRPTPAVRMKTSSGDGHRAERDRPWRVARDDDREREEKIVAHRRRDGDRIVRRERHEERGDGRRNARRREHGARIHARRTEHGRLHEHDVRHREERRDAGEDLRAHGRAGGRQAERAVEHAHGIGVPARSASDPLLLALTRRTAARTSAAFARHGRRPRHGLGRRPSSRSLSRCARTVTRAAGRSVTASVG